MPSEREIAAHHEAGHAVVALAFDATNLLASIRPRGISAGRVAHGPLPYRAADVVLFITLAGPFAHRRFAPRSNWVTTRDFALVDKTIFGKREQGLGDEKGKVSALYCSPSRGNRRLFLDRHQGRGEGAAQTRDANWR
jgi:hypothetical protein